MDSPWRFGVNDPDLFGWLTVATYLGAAALCWGCSWKASQFSHSGSSNQRRVWGALGLLMLMMGFNKQLDLQTPLIALGRNLINAEGWYRQRSYLKWLFISSLGIGGLGLLTWMGWVVRQSWQEYRWVFIGLVVLLLFVLIRAIPILENDEPSLRGLGKCHLLELLGIICVGLSAAVKLWRNDSPHV